MSQEKVQSGKPPRKITSEAELIAAKAQARELNAILKQAREDNIVVADTKEPRKTKSKSEKTKTKTFHRKDDKAPAQQSYKADAKSDAKPSKPKGKPKEDVASTSGEQSQTRKKRPRRPKKQPKEVDVTKTQPQPPKSTKGTGRKKAYAQSNPDRLAKHVAKKVNPVADNKVKTAALAKIVSHIKKTTTGQAMSPEAIDIHARLFAALRSQLPYTAPNTDCNKVFTGTVKRMLEAFSELPTELSVVMDSRIYVHRSKSNMYRQYLLFDTAVGTKGIAASIYHGAYRFQRFKTVIPSEVLTVVRGMVAKYVKPPVLKATIQKLHFEKGTTPGDFKIITAKPLAEIEDGTEVTTFDCIVAKTATGDVISVNRPLQHSFGYAFEGRVFDVPDASVFDGLYNPEGCTKVMITDSIAESTHTIPELLEGHSVLSRKDVNKLLSKSRGSLERYLRALTPGNKDWLLDTVDLQHFECEFLELEQSDMLDGLQILEDIIMFNFVLKPRQSGICIRKRYADKYRKANLFGLHILVHNRDDYPVVKFIPQEEQYYQNQHTSSDENEGAPTSSSKKDIFADVPLELLQRIYHDRLKVASAKLEDLPSTSFGKLESSAP